MTDAAARTFTSRPRERDRTTRRPLGWWDRVKLVLAAAALFGFFFAAELADNPLMSIHDALVLTVRSKWWILALGALEILRQLHYFLCEKSARYYRWWRDRVLAGRERRLGRISAYNRYRAARTFKLLAALAVVLLILARIFETSVFRAPFDFLSWALANAPAAVQVVIFLTFWIGFQFGLIIYFATRGGVETFFPDDIDIRFTDVWGQDQVLARIKENLLLLESPETIEDRGGYVPAGLLLWGPPGTGKTLMAEAMAGETGKPFVNVDASMLNTMGMGVLKVKLLFRKLRKYALKYDGVVVFFDEADAIGSRGQLAGMPGSGLPPARTGMFAHARECAGLSYLSDGARASLASPTETEVDAGTRRNRFFMAMGGGGGGGVLQVLLTEMSGLRKPRGLLNRNVRRLLGLKPKLPPKYRIVMVMATNLPEALDPAMLRPGRMGDRVYKVGYPSKAGRVRTYQGYLAKVPNTLTEEDVDRLATVTPYATGASIKALVNEALINAIEDGRDTVAWKDMVRAKQHKDLGPPEDVEYIERERHATALHEACHAVVAYRVRHHLVIDLATIEKGADYLGMVSSIPPEDLFTRWRSDYEADVMVSLASLIGERMFFSGDSSSGVAGDLETATQLAILMEGYWGMGQTLASHGVTHRVGVAGGGRPGAGDEHAERELLKGTLAQRIEDKLADLYERTEALITANRVEILAVTHALETHKTLTGEDIEAVIEGRRGPLVDGRPYATEEFATLAEDYHAQALEAHAAHGDMPVTLPVLDPIVDEPAEPVAEVGAEPSRSGSHGSTDSATADAGTPWWHGLTTPGAVSDAASGAPRAPSSDAGFDDVVWNQLDWGGPHLGPPGQSAKTHDDPESDEDATEAED